MGVALIDEDLAIKKSAEIPKECRRYISHYLRNGLVSIMCYAEKIREDPGAIDELEAYIRRLACDMEKIGL